MIYRTLASIYTSLIMNNYCDTYFIFAIIIILTAIFVLCMQGPLNFRGVQGCK